MALDLSKFVKEFEAVVPIINGHFQYNRKKYLSEDTVSGWYRVGISGNQIRLKEEVFDLSSVKYPSIRGYTYNNSIIFQNFDVSKRKYNLEVSAPLYFNKSDTFSAIEAVVWEDRKVFFKECVYSDFKIYEVKNCFDNDQLLEDIKAITPELRTLFIFHSLERDQIRELDKIRLQQLAEAERARLERELMSTLKGRLQYTFSNAGATLLKYSLTGNRAVVDWLLDSTGQEFNSVIDTTTFKVIEAGYCMSHDDTRHNITSMVKLAKDYEDEGLIYKTRS